jgi:hypothetical protein
LAGHLGLGISLSQGWEHINVGDNLFRETTKVEKTEILNFNLLVGLVIKIQDRFLLRK